VTTDRGEPLSGGVLAAGITRVGGTVRRPAGPWTPTVHALLRHLERAGFDGAPRVLGTETGPDGAAWELLEYLPGEVAWGPAHHRLLGSDEALRAAGRLLRRYHEAVGGFAVPAGARWRFPEMAADAEPWVGIDLGLGDGGRLVCHNDPGGWNLVVGPTRMAFLDWDVVGVRPPIWDVAYAAVGLIPVGPDPAASGWDRPPPVPERLAALAGGYGLDDRTLARLPEVMVARVASSFEHFRGRARAGIAPWAELWTGGHGQVWADRLGFAVRHRAEWAAALGA